MASLRRCIDQHEKSILESISINEEKQKKQFEEYKNQRKNQLQDSNIQKATFEILSSNKYQTKLLQNKQKFDDYMNETNGILKSLPMLTRTEYELQEHETLQIVKTKIQQCRTYIEKSPHSNPELEKFLAKNQTKKELDMDGRKLTDSDIKIVADTLRKSMVRK